MTVWITTNWEILKEIGIPDHLTCLLRNLYAVQEATAKKKKKQQVEKDMKQWTGSKSGQEYIKALYYHPAYLMCMQNTSWDMLGWMNHKLESSLPGELSVTSDDTTLTAESEGELKNLLMRVKEE